MQSTAPGLLPASYKAQLSISARAHDTAGVHNSSGCRDPQAASQTCPGKGLLKKAAFKSDQRAHAGCEEAAQGAAAVCRLTLTKDSGETGLRWPEAASEGAFLTAGAGWRWSREKTCTVPLSEDRASHCGRSPRLNAMLYMHAGSAPLRSSCTFGARQSCKPGSMKHRSHGFIDNRS